MARNLLLVAVGAACGGVLRYLVSLAVTLRVGTTFPFGTLLVNLVGSLLIGLILGGASRVPLTEPLRLLLVTGILGGFTTFSSFAWEVLSLLQSDRMLAAFAYAATSLGGGLLCAACGVWLARLALPG